MQVSAEAAQLRARLSVCDQQISDLRVQSAQVISSLLSKILI